jgi:hypothetical protein
MLVIGMNIPSSVQTWNVNHMDMTNGDYITFISHGGRINYMGKDASGLCN